jgi:hypothetical protein
MTPIVFFTLEGKVVAVVVAADVVVVVVVVVSIAISP